MSARGGVSVPFLFAQPLADGRIKYHWKPSPRLRRMGWQNLDCGTDRKQAIAMAEARNEELAKWERGLAADAGARPAPVNVRDAVARYRATVLKKLRPRTRETYDTALRKILAWAGDGQVAVAHIDRQSVLELRNALMEGGPNGAGGNMLRVLRAFLSWCVDAGLLAVNPAEKIGIPVLPPRNHVIRAPAVELLVDTARRLGLDSVALAIELGLWTMQRESDLLAYVRSDWRIVAPGDVPAAAASALADARGDVWAFTRRQAKTRQWVAAPVPPAVRDRVHAVLAARDADRVVALPVLCDDGRARAYPQRLFIDRFDRVRMWAWWRAMMVRDWRLAGHIRRSRFGDLRRTGMCFYAEHGVPVAWIAAISGHSIDYTSKILEHYLPANSRFAMLGIAELLTRTASQSDAPAATPVAHATEKPSHG